MPVPPYDFFFGESGLSDDDVVLEMFENGISQSHTPKRVLKE